MKHIKISLVICAFLALFQLSYSQETVDVIYVRSGNAALDQATGAAMAGVVNNLNSAAAQTTGDYFVLKVVDNLDELNDLTSSPDAGDSNYAVMHGNYDRETPYSTPTYQGTLSTTAGPVVDTTWYAEANVDATFHCGMNLEYDPRSKEVGTIYPDTVGKDIAAGEGDINYQPVYQMAPMYIEN